MESRNIRFPYVTRKSASMLLEIRWYHVKRPLSGRFFLCMEVMMKFTVPQLETSRCYVRGMELEDALEIYSYMSLPSVKEYLHIPLITSIEDMMIYMEDVYLNYMDQQQPQCWCIEDKQTMMVIGQVCFYQYENDCAYLECILHPSYWGQGLMKEVLQPIIQVGFTQFQLEVVYAQCKHHNERMKKLLKSCGFHESLLHQKPNATHRIYFITKEDWRNTNENISREI